MFYRRGCSGHLASSSLKGPSMHSRRWMLVHDLVEKTRAKKAEAAEISTSTDSATTRHCAVAGSVFSRDLHRKATPLRLAPRVCLHPATSRNVVQQAQRLVWRCPCHKEPPQRRRRGDQRPKACVKTMSATQQAASRVLLDIDQAARQASVWNLSWD